MCALEKNLAPKKMVSHISRLRTSNVLMSTPQWLEEDSGRGLGTRQKVLHSHLIWSLLLCSLSKLDFMIVAGLEILALWLLQKDELGNREAPMLQSHLSGKRSSRCNGPKSSLLGKPRAALGGQDLTLRKCHLSAARTGHLAERPIALF